MRDNIEKEELEADREPELGISKRSKWMRPLVRRLISIQHNALE